MSDNQLAVIEQSLEQIDKFVESQDLTALTGTTGGFKSVGAISTAMLTLQQMLTPEVMKPITALQGSKLGFRTDNDRAGGYSPEVLRDALIEATLKGFFPVNNEMNVIAGNCYITKEGFQGWFKRQALKGRCTYPDIRLSPPKTVADGSVVVASASCVVNNKTVEVKDAEIPVKGQGADQILGKATRKILARLYEKVTGMQIGDGDVTEPDVNTMKRAETTDAAPGATTTTAREFCDEATVTKLDKMFADHEEYLNPFLLKQGYIQQGETFRKVSPAVADRMLNHKKALLEQCGAVIPRK